MPSYLGEMALLAACARAITLLLLCGSAMPQHHSPRPLVVGGSNFLENPGPNNSFQRSCLKPPVEITAGPTSPLADAKGHVFQGKQGNFTKHRALPFLPGL